MEFKPFKIGKYLLLERLAMGGMAEVYRAKASGAGGFEKQLAIKRILPNYSQNDEFRRMFEYEARLSSQLTHANIVQIYDFVKSGETYLLAMEYVDGKNLRQFINKLKKANIVLPIETGLYLINEVCKGLEYAHKKKDDLTGRPLNIIHRDMSPQNVMLSYEAGVKIVDFGIAKAKDRVDETRSGVIKGKFGYMSPEQANGEEVDHHTDIFSTGIILWELLTGKRLFATENDMATLKLIQECVIPPPSKLNPKVTPELEKIVLKGLAKDRSLRFQSAGLMQRALQEFLNKYYPSFSQKDVSDLVHRTFAEEITQEKKRYEQIYRQSIPFSQGVTTEEDDSMPSTPEEKVEGQGEEEEEGITYSGAEEKTGETFAGDDEEESQASAAPSEELPSDYDDPRTMISQSFHPEELAEESKAEEAKKEKTENTQVESFSIEDTSLSGLGPDISWNSEMGTPGPKDQNQREDRTVIDNDSATDARSETPTEPRQKPSVAAKTAVTEPKKSSISGLTLENTGSNSRRERSASFIRNFETPASKESVKLAAEQSSNSVQSSGLSIDRGSYNERPGRESKPRQSAPDDDNIYNDWRQSSVEPKPGLMSSVPGILVILIALSGGFFLYNLYFGGGLKRLVDTVASIVSGKPSRPRQITSPEGTVPPPATPADPPPARPETEECSVTFESEPALAQVYIDHKARGQTPTTLLVDCNKSINYDLRRFGYETISENIYTKNRQEKVYKNLKPIPMGTLELAVTQNATIEIKEIDFKQEVKAQEWVEIPLRSGRRYRVLIYNNAMGQEGGYKEFAVTEGTRIKEVIRLEELSPPK